MLIFRLQDLFHIALCNSAPAVFSRNSGLSGAVLSLCNCLLNFLLVSVFGCCRWLLVLVLLLLLLVLVLVLLVKLSAIFNLLMIFFCWCCWWLWFFLWCCCCLWWCCWLDSYYFITLLFLVLLHLYQATNIFQLFKWLHLIDYLINYLMT